jgi:hypothetical protein
MAAPVTRNIGQMQTFGAGLARGTRPRFDK